MSSINDFIDSDYDLGGTFVFGNTEYTSCNISSNGFIFFGNIHNIFSYNPFSNLQWKTIAPFAGDLQTTKVGLTVNKEPNVITIVFNCYSNPTEQNNLLVFSVTLYLNHHETRPNQVDFHYISSDSRMYMFPNNYYIGYCDGISPKYLGNVDDITSFSYGGLNIYSKNVFPKSGTTISNITNILPQKILSNATLGLAYNIPLSRTNETFIFGGSIYTLCNISSNGFIFFDIMQSGPTATTTDILQNDSWKIIFPFCGYLATTSDGIFVDNEDTYVKITFNCYSIINSVENTVIFSVILYLNNHVTRPNQVDFEYTSSESRHINYRNNYYIGYCDGKKYHCITNTDEMFLVNGKSTIKSKNKFPESASKIMDVTNFVSDSEIYLVSCYDRIGKNIDLGGTLYFGEKKFTSFNLSTNGFIYFDINFNASDIYTDDNVIEPNECATNPFYNDKWYIISPFCAKLKTTSAGILVKRFRNICSITWNCYTNPVVNSETVEFTLELTLDDPNLEQSKKFIYSKMSGMYSIKNIYIGFCDSITQKCLQNSGDIFLTDGNNFTSNLPNSGQVIGF